MELKKMLLLQNKRYEAKVLKKEQKEMSTRFSEILNKSWTIHKETGSPGHQNVSQFKKRKDLYGEIQYVRMTS